jgi:hypothetical protein
MLRGMKVLWVAVVGLELGVFPWRRDAPPPTKGEEEARDCLSILPSDLTSVNCKAAQKSLEGIYKSYDDQTAYTLKQDPASLCLF